MTPVDDELVSAYLDGELDAKEALAVSALIEKEEAWRRRWEAFRSDSELLRRSAIPPLAKETREVVYRAVTEKFELGVERRRVPRFQRRWMLLAAFTVPCLLTLVYLQNPTTYSRLYLRGDEIVLRAGRSGQRSEFQSAKEWKSPALWGQWEASQTSLMSFQVDAQQAPAQSVSAEVFYDFDGDGNIDRSEVYEAVSLDSGLGWERFSPPLLNAQGAFEDFQGGTVRVILQSRDQDDVGILLSGTPGELVLPFRGLSAEAPLSD